MHEGVTASIISWDRLLRLYGRGLWPTQRATCAAGLAGRDVVFGMRQDEARLVERTCVRQVLSLGVSADPSADPFSGFGICRELNRQRHD